jgi:peptide-methionine (R)-S-oxide reductase
MLRMGRDEGWLTKEEYRAMDPASLSPARFYQLFKVHKAHDPGALPPGRPIISGSGSLTENISRFIDFHIKGFVKEIPSYLQDTPDFLRTLEDINKQGPLPKNAILVTVDVSALYTNIKHEEGVQVLKSFLELRKDKLEVPVDFLTNLMEKVLSLNIFEFDNMLYRQAIGTAMGTPCAVSYANIFMSKIDSLLLDLGKSLNNDSSPLLAFKRFIDDIFFIFCGNVEQLELFLSQINQIHPTIKFTAQYSCPFTCDITDAHDCFCQSSQSIPFLDTSVSIKNGKLITDLYKKPTDRCQYLLPQSCHPANICKNIPFSLAYRLVRICSERSALLKRLDELKELLLSRKYNVKIVNNAIFRATQVSRVEALERVEKKKTRRVVFALEYHPALPDVNKIVRRSWRNMVKDPYLKAVFPEPPMIAFRRPKSLKDLLVRAKVPPPPTRKSTRHISGMKKCGNCVVCPYVDEIKTCSSLNSSFSVKVNKPVSCCTENVIYLISCTKCSEQYVGQTGREFKKRMQEHLGYINNFKFTEPTGKHFNLPNHDISMFKCSIIEKCTMNSKVYRENREENFIKLFQTKFKGMNRKM